MIIDAHAHLAPSLEKDDIDARFLLREMDKNGVDKAVLLPLLPFASNEYVKEIADKFPTRFTPFASFEENHFASFEERSF